LNLRPDVAVVTNIEAEHLDYYDSEAEIVRTFARFLHRLPPTGRAVICGDCPNALEASATLDGRRVTYGFGSHCDFTAADIECQEYRTRFNVFRGEQRLGQMTIGVPGRQNVLNALATTVAAFEAGIPFDTVSASLSEFHGIGRRFQKVGESRGILIIDDYAHHPSEIRATLRAAREGFPGRRLVCAFQPHRYTRTQLLRDEFGTAFVDADAVFITDVYAAGEPAIDGVSGAMIAEAISEHDPQRAPAYVRERRDLCDALREAMQPGDLVMTLGAGNIWESAVQLARSLDAPVVAEPPVS
jgi:UDP-N-acetylmuramate--alanine ligase